jgi:hypothetical protein
MPNLLSSPIAKAMRTPIRTHRRIFIQLYFMRLNHSMSIWYGCIKQRSDCTGAYMQPKPIYAIALFVHACDRVACFSSISYPCSAKRRLTKALNILGSISSKVHLRGANLCPKGRPRKEGPSMRRERCLIRLLSRSSLRIAFLSNLTIAFF